MKFSTTLAALSSLTLAAAQNAFTMPTLPSIIHAGTPFNLTWQATTPGDVSIWLVQGSASDTKYIATIAGNITNSGQFTWTPSSSLQSGSNYALEIVSDSDTFITNYSGQFSLDGGSSSPNNSSGSSTSSGASSTTGSSSATTTGSTSATTTGSSSAASGNSKTTMATVTGTSTGSATATGSSVPDSNKSAAGAVEAVMSIVGLAAAAAAFFAL